MQKLIKQARAFIFAAEEDFGIAPIEAQACGIPVIAYGKGGALETINGVFPSKNKISNESTGVFFKKQSVSSLIEAIDYFEINETLFDKKAIRKNTERFSIERFEKEFKETVETLYNNWKENQ